MNGQENEAPGGGGRPARTVSACGRFSRHPLGPSALFFGPARWRSRKTATNFAPCNTATLVIARGLLRGENALLTHRRVDRRTVQYRKGRDAGLASRPKQALRGENRHLTHGKRRRAFEARDSGVAAGRSDYAAQSPDEANRWRPRRRRPGHSPPRGRARSLGLLRLLPACARESCLDESLPVLHLFSDGRQKAHDTHDRRADRGGSGGHSELRVMRAKEAGRSPRDGREARPRLLALELSLQMPDAGLRKLQGLDQVFGQARHPVGTVGGQEPYLAMAIRGPEAEMTDDEREALAAHYIRLSGREEHTSLCATSRAPAVEPGECDCEPGRTVSEMERVAAGRA